MISLGFQLLLSAQKTKIDTYYNFYEEYRSGLNLNAVLKLNGKQSVFEVDDKIIEDKTEQLEDKAGNPLTKISKKPKENRQVYKDFLDNTLLSLDASYDPKNYFYISENIPNFDWKIENDEKEILKYKCKKALTTYRGRNYIAWFAPSIPISDGPWKFAGLPGLILEITDENNSIKIVANKIVLNPEKTDFLFKINNNYPKVNWRTYTENINKDFDKQMKFFKSMASEQDVELSLDFKFENMEYSISKNEKN